MKIKMLAGSALAALIVVAATIGGALALVGYELGNAEAKITKAVSFGEDPGKAATAYTDVNLVGTRFLFGRNAGSALVVMGTRYEYGAGVDQDLTAALESFKKAAERGDDVGEMMLGRLYDFSATTPDQQRQADNFSPDGTEDDYLTNAKGGSG